MLSLSMMDTDKASKGTALGPRGERRMRTTPLTSRFLIYRHTRDVRNAAKTRKRVSTELVAIVVDTDTNSGC